MSFMPSHTGCNGGVCDGTGTCVGCLTPADCAGGTLPNATVTCDGTCGYFCDAGYQDCNGTGDGCESHKNTDSQNCGGCGVICSAPNGTAACSNGVCVVSACNPGYLDCNGIAADGCEVNSDRDTDNCGQCGHVCPAIPNGVVICANGACGLQSCDPGWDHCDLEGPVACETFVGGGDVNNCGSCGHVCNLPHVVFQLCSAGTCQTVSCETGWGNCDHDPTTGCEHDLSDDDDNCGGCGFQCQGSTHCVMGECVS
jgi:hypothetical protein